MKDQVTSIEQSKRLIELGVPAQKASMVWRTMSTKTGRRKLQIACEEDIGWLCRNFPTQYAPAFTVADLLGLLPKEIEDTRTGLHYLTIQHTSKKYSEIEYKGAYGVIWSCFGPSLLDNLVEAINWAINSRQELNI